MGTVKQMLFGSRIFFVLGIAAGLLAGQGFCGENAGGADCWDYETLSEGIQLVKLGDVNGASLVLQKSSKRDGVLLDWRNELESLTQIVTMQENLKQEKNAVRWYAVAEQLKKVYLEKGLRSEAVLQAKQIYARLKTLPSALDVVETCIETGLLDEAESVIEYFALKFRGDSEALAAVEIAKCRLYLESEKPESARAAVRQIKAADIQTPELLLSLARVQAATRQFSSAVQTLTKCFTLTPPEVLASVKVEASNCKEWANIQNSYEFSQAMQTKSSLSSGCSSCAKKWLKWQQLESSDQKAKMGYTMDGICVGDWRIK
jgi:tetratricopeptide (TPR) repeat protein